MQRWDVNTRWNVIGSRYAEESQAAITRITLHDRSLVDDGVILQAFVRTRQHARPAQTYLRKPTCQTRLLAEQASKSAFYNAMPLSQATAAESVTTGFIVRKDDALLRQIQPR